MPFLLLFLAWLCWGVWAVAVKKCGDLGVQWTYIVQALFCVVTLPLDAWVIYRADWTSRPSWTGIAWAVTIIVVGLVAQILAVQVAPKFSGNTLTVVGATYPVAAMAIFWLMGTKPTAVQLLGTAVVLVGVALVCLGDR